MRPGRKGQRLNQIAIRLKQDAGPDTLLGRELKLVDQVVQPPGQFVLHLIGRCRSIEILQLPALKGEGGSILATDAVANVPLHQLLETKRQIGETLEIALTIGTPEADAADDGDVR